MPGHEVLPLTSYRTGFPPGRACNRLAAAGMIRPRGIETGISGPLRQV